jgi:acetyl/propionyl-CoA carboxylase alpha subunit
MGMRVVRAMAEVAPAFEAARAQAQSAFGNPEVFAEKFHERPRHIEVQVLGLGPEAITLGERECSVQRRYQKLLEEAPSPALDEEQRARVQDLARQLFTAAQYRNAGTAEFLFVDGRFYFNEVNARLQVEHPVTELVTGLDLVHAQLRIAAGEDLPFRQRDVRIRGWALECRINAEDPFADFRPSPGLVREHRPPAGPGVRVDAGVEEGDTIPSAYDSLLSKVIAYGATRGDAVLRMQRALGEYRVHGVRTTIPFHQLVLADEAFQRGALHTKLLEERGLTARLRELGERRAARHRARVAALGAVFQARPALLAAQPMAPAQQGMGAWQRAAREEAVRRWP